MPLCLFPSELPSPPGDGDHQSDSHARPRWEAAFLQGREVSRREGSSSFLNDPEYSSAPAQAAALPLQCFSMRCSLLLQPRIAS